jgi:tetracycline repressor-like protein
MICGTTSGALLIAQWPVPSTRCTSVFGRPWKTRVSDFGSKEGLLDAATNPPQKSLESIAKVWTTPIQQLGKAWITLLLASWADDEIGPTLRAILQTAAHEPTTREKLRRVVEGSLMGVSELGSDERDRLTRSGLVSSQMMGFALMRYVWKIEPVASMPDDEAIAATAPNLQHYVNGDLTGRVIPTGTGGAASGSSRPCRTSPAARAGWCASNTEPLPGRCPAEGSAGG